MRKLALVAMLAVGAARVAGECVVVEAVPVYKSASSELRVHVLDGGKPTKNLAVTLSAMGKSEMVRVLTNQDGVARFSRVAAGDYTIHAETGNTHRGDVYVRVTDIRQSSMQPSEMILKLEDVSPASVPPTEAPVTGAQLDKLEMMPAQEVAKRFSGTAQDPSGAGVPGVAVWIVPKGARKGEQMKRLTADANGHFEADVADGMYTVVIWQMGFGVKQTKVEVRGAAEAKDFKVTVVVESC